MSRFSDANALFTLLKSVRGKNKLRYSGKRDAVVIATWDRPSGVEGLWESLERFSSKFGRRTSVRARGFEEKRVESQTSDAEVAARAKTHSVSR